MKKMSLNTNFQILLNTNNFLLYNNPRINEFLLWKNQKYSSEEQKIYIIPIEKQNKLILKQKQFRILFLNYKYKYYYLFIYKLFSKYIRKKFIYDFPLNDNNKLTIKLDKKYLPSINAKRFFKKYSKLKNALEVVSKQKKETLRELNYIESIVYEIESSTTIDELTLIFDEISENDIFKERTEKTKQNKKNKIKKSKLTKNKEVSFNPIKYKIGNYTVLVGRNNVENDYLTLKYARKTDLWFHTKDFHGSHTILKIDNNLPYPSQDILIKVAEIAAKHSKAKNSSNVPVDYCEVKYVKKPSGSRPGMVIYTNNKTLNVNP